MPDEPIEYQLFHALEDAGLAIPDATRPAAMAAIEEALDAHGDRRAAEALCWILDRMPGGQRGAELRAALLGAVDDDGQAMADRFNTSRQNWSQRVKRLRESIFKNRLPPAPL